MFCLHHRLKTLRHALFDWSRAGTSNSARLIQDLVDARRTAVQQTQVDWHEVHRLESALDTARHQECQYWRQRGRFDWYQNGDRNTAFFHRSVQALRKRNRLGDLLDSAGRRCTTEEEKGAVAVSFYTDLFASELPTPIPTIEELALQPLVTPSMAASLTAPVLPSEIRKAVFSRSHPGPWSGWVYRSVLSAILGCRGPCGHRGGT
ncbi:hypothetical protein LINGRAHAP2_LOCUS20453 [Linum grandiflorum]